MASMSLSVTVLLLAWQAAGGPMGQEPQQCYRFDKHHFSWTSDVFLGDSTLLDTAAVIGDSLVADFTVASGTWFKVLDDSSLVPWRSVSAESSDVAMLLAQPHPSGRPGAQVMRPPAMPELRSTRSIRQLSYWRPVATDSVEIGWLTGHANTIFRMGLRGDTLRGRVRFTADIVGRKPRIENAWAARVVCPADKGTPPNKRMQQTARVFKRKVVAL